MVFGISCTICLYLLFDIDEKYTFICVELSNEIQIVAYWNYRKMLINATRIELKIDLKEYFLGNLSISVIYLTTEG